MKQTVTAIMATGILALAPTAAAAPNDDPNQWPVADNAAYTSVDDPGWVFFRAYGSQGQGCGIGPDGTVGCDIVVQRNEDGTVMQVGAPGPSGFYRCANDGDQTRCPLPPPGTNQVVADPVKPARYVESDTMNFTRDVEVLPEGYRLVNGNAWCYVSAASPGGINCQTGDNGFLWSSWGGVLEPVS